MKYVYLFIILCFTHSCKENNRNELIGVWESEFITLEITNNTIVRSENGKTIEYGSYEIYGDTLKMNNQNVIEEHLIKIKKGTKLIFSPVNPYEKDIELIDETIFNKVKK